VKTIEDISKHVKIIPDLSSINQQLRGYRQADPFFSNCVATLRCTGQGVTPNENGMLGVPVPWQTDGSKP